MADFRAVGWKLSDFSGAVSARANAGATTGAFALNSTATLNPEAEMVDLPICDETTLGPDGTNHFVARLKEDVTLGATTCTAGEAIEADYVLTTAGLPRITFVVARIGTGGPGREDARIVFSDQPMIPGQTFRFTGTADRPAERPATMCFADGTRIDTPEGPCPIEDLQVGDRVLTRDHGQQPIEWIGRHDLSAWDLLSNPAQRPIRIRAQGPEADDLLVSPQHRVLVSGWKAELMFGARDVLAPASALCNGRTVTVDRLIDCISYHHLSLPVHGLVRADGHWAESLQTGSDARRTAATAHRAPFLPPARAATVSALPSLSPSEALLLA